MVRNKVRTVFFSKKKSKGKEKVRRQILLFQKITW